MPFWSRLAGTSPPCPWPTRSPSSEVSSCISSLAWLSFPGAPWSTTNGGSATPSSPLLSASSSPRSALLSSVGLSSSSSSAPSPPPTLPKRLSGTSSSSSPRWRGRHCMSSLPIHPTACSRTIKPNSLGLRSPPSTRCTTLPSSSSACPPASAGCSGPLWETRDLAGSRAPTPRRSSTSPPTRPVPSCEMEYNVQIPHLLSTTAKRYQPHIAHHAARALFGPLRPTTLRTMPAAVAAMDPKHTVSGLLKLVVVVVLRRRDGRGDGPRDVLSIWAQCDVI
mmetsp:Transcript_51171/g.111256  ORF Transcript_51171/g.111256 Transcript_51171/m.111256 type:complete len:279 (+) Transcript_51171:710-1546(+)